MPPEIGGRVTLGGESRLIRYTASSLTKAQEMLDGENLATTFQQVAMISLRHITVMVWAGLLHDDPELQVSDVTDLIEPPMKPIISAISDGVKPWVGGAGNASAKQSAAGKKKATSRSSGPGPGR